MQSSANRGCIPFPSHTTALGRRQATFTVGLVTRAWLLANAVALRANNHERSRILRG